MCRSKMNSLAHYLIWLICENGRNYSMFFSSPHFKHVRFVSRLILLQFINDVSERTPTTWEQSKSLAWKFFCEGENKNEMICQLCPTQKIIRKWHSGTSNLLKHVKRMHFKEYMSVKAKSNICE